MAASAIEVHFCAADLLFWSGRILARCRHVDAFPALSAAELARVALALKLEADHGLAFRAIAEQMNLAELVREVY